MRILSVLFAVVFSTHAQASCLSGAELFMSCDFPNGKFVEVCAGNDTASYWFGPQGGQPELAMTVPRSQVNYEPWSGVGSSIFEAVTFHNNAVSYEVYGAIDRQVTGASKDIANFGGINVFEKGRQIATLECRPSTVDFPWTEAFSR